MFKCELTNKLVPLVIFLIFSTHVAAIVLELRSLLFGSLFLKFELHHMSKLILVIVQNATVLPHK